MILPPLSMWLSIDAPGRRSPHVWLPLFLLWLLLLPFVLLIFAFAVIADLVLLIAGSSYHHYSVLLVHCLQLVADTRGMVVRVFDHGTTVDVTIN